MPLYLRLRGLGLVAAPGRVRTWLLLFPLVGLALLAAKPARAELYKWADDNGVIHYSTVAPAKTKDSPAFKRLSREALSVPEAKVPKRAVPQAVQHDAAEDLNGKIEALERQIETERQARLAAEAQSQAMQTAYAQAVAEQQAARNVSYSPTAIPTIPSVSGVLLLSAPQSGHYDGCRSTGAGMLMTYGQPAHRSRAEPSRFH